MSKLNRMILHWTAGGNIPNAIDRIHYHYLIDQQGKIYNGKYKPEDNMYCTSEKYAAHTGGGNTGSIGVALCGMLGFRSSKEVGNYQLTLRQCEAAFNFIAGLCDKYDIPVTPQTVMTHYEFGKAHPSTTSFGKIDIIYLPPYPRIPTDKIGDFIRDKVIWYQQERCK